MMTPGHLHANIVQQFVALSSSELLDMTLRRRVLPLQLQHVMLNA
jgi:hypothetical protein